MRKSDYTIILNQSINQSIIFFTPIVTLLQMLVIIQQIMRRRSHRKARYKYYTIEWYMAIITARNVLIRYSKFDLIFGEISDAVFTRDTFAWGKCHFTIENVTQYNRNVNLPQVNVSRVNKSLVSVQRKNIFLEVWLDSHWPISDQQDICMMTSFDCNYQNAFCCSLCFAHLCHARAILHKRKKCWIQ